MLCFFRADIVGCNFAGAVHKFVDLALVFQADDGGIQLGFQSIRAFADAHRCTGGVEEIKVKLRAFGDGEFRVGRHGLFADDVSGDQRIDLIGLANQVEQALAACEKPITVAVMGCVVNGPGEAREADVGIAGGDGCGILFVKGRQLKKLPYDELLPALLAYIGTL